MRSHSRGQYLRNSKRFLNPCRLPVGDWRPRTARSHFHESGTARSIASGMVDYSSRKRRERGAGVTTAESQGTASLGVGGYDRCQLQQGVPFEFLQGATQALA